MKVLDESTKVDRFPGLFGFVESLFLFVTGKFLETDDGIINGLLERQKSESANVALVSALLLTITFSYLPAAVDWEDGWLKGAFCFACSLCNSFIVCSVTLSTCLLLILSALKDDLEARKFIDLIKQYGLVPFRCLWGAICLFGFVVGILLLFKLTFDNNNWFYYIVGLTYSPAMVILPLTASAYVKQLYEVRMRDVKVPVLKLSHEEVVTVFERYVKQTCQDGDIELLPTSGSDSDFESFCAYTVETYKAGCLARLTRVRMRQHFIKMEGELDGTGDSVL